MRILCYLCGAPSLARGMCQMHYRRWWRTGDPHDRPTRSVKDRLLSLAIVPDDPDACWGWRGSKSHGYGRIAVDGRPVQAQRVSYEVHVGPIPDGYEVDHTCRRTECSNPRHLEAVTGAENLRRQALASVRCASGHYINPADGCRRCGTERSAA